MFGNPVPGYPSLIVVILFLSGIQLFFTGVIGEYLGRVFNETKGRPLYFINGYQPAEFQVIERLLDESGRADEEHIVGRDRLTMLEQKVE